MTKAIQYNENQNHSNISVYKQKPQQNYLYTPANFSELMKYSEIIANSSICPKNYQGKTGDVFVAMQLGAELGLKPLQAIQNISVINGKPSVWGDAALALVQASSVCEYIKEHYNEKEKAAVCVVKRRGHDEHIVKFGEEDARKAKLWNKQGPWQEYPQRMMQMRARGFALRDKFPEVLKGLILAEEAQDYPVDVAINVTPTFQAQPQSVNVEQKLTAQEPEQTIIAIENATHEQDESKEIQATLVEYISMYNVPDEVVEKWKVAAKQEDLYDFSDEQATSCIELIRKKYSSIDGE